MPDLPGGSVRPILVVYALAVPAPGPSVVAIARACLDGGARAGMLAGLGTTAGVAVHAAAAPLGLSAPPAGLPGLGAAIQIAGGAYLVHLGLGTLRARIAAPAPAIARGQAAGTGRRSPGRILGRAVLVSLSDPKVAIFFARLFAPMVDRSDTTQARRVALVGVVAIDAVYHQTRAALLSTLSGFASARRVSGRLDALAGCLMTAFGAPPRRRPARSALNAPPRDWSGRAQLFSR